MSKTVSADLFQNLLMMVSENYEIISDKKHEIFNEGVQQYTQYVFLQDAIIDNDVNWSAEQEEDTNILQRLSLNYRYAIQNLTFVFDVHHKFWDFLRYNEEKYYRYIVQEKHCNTQRPTLTISNFQEMTEAKHCLAFVPLQGMEFLYSFKFWLEELQPMFVAIFNGMQMMDDIDDFTKDLHAGQWNLIQYEVSKMIHDEGLVNDGSLDKFEERVFYASGLCKQYSEYVLQQYEIALKFAEDFGFAQLKSWLKTMILEIEESIRFVDEMMDD